MPLSDIRPAPRNPKAHADEEIRGSIARFGLAELPLLDERTGRLVAGHGRVDQLTAMRHDGQDPPEGVTVDPATGEWLVPVIRGWASRSDPDAEAYLVGSNNLTVLGGWDERELAELLANLNEVDPDLLAVTGFTDEDLAALLAEQDDDGPPPGRTDPDDAPEPPDDPISKPGDLWQLGPHRIIVGDCRDYNTIERLLAGVRVNVAFTSPPYASQRAYDESSGFKPIPPDQYVDWFEDVQANIRAVLADDGSWFVNIKEHCQDGQRHLYVKDLTIAHVRRWGWRFVDEFAWCHNGMPGKFVGRFKNAWEPVFHFAAIDALKHRPAAVMVESDKAFSYKAGGYEPTATGNNGFRGDDVDYGQGLALPSNVVSISTKDPRAHGVEHAAMFPSGLPAWFIRAYSDPDDVVFDPFMGSGTTLIAAHQEGRVGYGCEISPRYADVICRRFQEHTGIVPILDATGEAVDFTTTPDD